jgi:hypothetical protein
MADPFSFSSRDTPDIAEKPFYFRIQIREMPLARGHSDKIFYYCGQVI